MHREFAAALVLATVTTYGQFAGERPIGTPHLLVARGAEKAIADSSSRGHLLVWSDSGTIFGARFDMAGVLRDPVAVPIVTRDNDLGQVQAVLFTREGYTILFNSSTQDLYALGIDTELHMTFAPRLVAKNSGFGSAISNGRVIVVTARTGYVVLSMTGDLLEQHTQRLALLTRYGDGFLMLLPLLSVLPLDAQGHAGPSSDVVLSGTPLAIACAGGGCVAITRDLTNRLFATQFVPTVTQTFALPIASASGVTLTADGGRYSLVTGGEQLMLAENGAPVAGPVPAATSLIAQLRAAVRTIAPQTAPQTVFGSRNLLATWNEPSGGYAARMAFDGTMLDAPAAPACSGGVRSAVHDQYGYVLACGDQTIVRVNDDGVVSPPVAPLSSCFSPFTLATNGSSTVATRRNCDGNIVIAPVDVRGLAAPEVPLASGPHDAPVAAWNGRAWLVAWMEVGGFGDVQPQPGALRIAGIRVSAELMPLNAPFTIADAPRFQTYDRLRVASDGSDFLAAWTSSDVTVHARRVSASGALISDDVVLASQAAFAGVVWDGVRYTIAYTAVSNTDSDAMLGHVAATGTPLFMDRLFVAATQAAESASSVASDGRTTLVTFTRSGNAPSRAYVRSFPQPARRRSVRVMREVVHGDGGQAEE